MNNTTTQTTEVIRDMRGSAYSANQLHVINNKLYYCGSPIKSLIKDESGKSAHYYNIIQYGVNVGTIALTDEDLKKANDILNPIDFTRVAGDINGNSRFVCHFLAFVGEKDKNLDIHEKYKLALNRSRQLGGKKFHNKQYGGGIVFQMYKDDIHEMSRKIREIANS